MPLKHLSQEDMENYVNENYSETKKYKMKQHLIQCKKCQNKVDDYILMIREIKKIKNYEPCSNLVNLVTQGLPDIYGKKGKSIFEIFSLIAVFIPVNVIMVYLFYSLEFKFISFTKIAGLFASLMNLLNKCFNASQFIHNNIEIFALFIFYLFVFKIFDWLVLQNKENKICT